MPTSLGPAEILVILVVALIVLGPKRLPEAGRQVGKALGEVKRWSQGVQDEIKTAMDPVAASPPPGMPEPAPEPPAPAAPPLYGPPDDSLPAMSEVASPALDKLPPALDKLPAALDKPAATADMPAAAPDTPATTSGMSPATPSVNGKSEPGTGPPATVS